MALYIVKVKYEWYILTINSFDSPGTEAGPLSRRFSLLLLLPLLLYLKP